MPREDTMAFEPTEPTTRTIEEILTRYPNKQAACIPVLHACQDQLGWCSTELISWVAQRLDLSTAHVLGVVTFYTLFNQAPVGRHQVWVCQTLPCALRGGEDLLKHCEKRLGIHVGQTTTDGAITLRSAECLASCGTAPMMQVNRAYHENLTNDQADVILTELGATLR